MYLIKVWIKFLTLVLGAMSWTFFVFCCSVV